MLKLTKPLSCSPEQSFGVRRLQPGHAAADDHGFEADFADGADDGDRLPGLRADRYDVGIGRLYLPDDGRQVGHAWREALIVDDLQAGSGGRRPDAVHDRVTEFHLGIDGGDRFWFRIHRHRRVEERLQDRQSRLLAGREDAEEFVVFELGVIREAEEADQHHVMLHGDRYRRGDDRRGVAATDEIDLVDIDELGVDRRHIGRIALVVVVHELDLPSEQAALGVDILCPHGHRQQRRFSSAGERAGFGHAEADLQGLLRGRRRAERRQAQRGECRQRRGANGAS